MSGTASLFFSLIFQKKIMNITLGKFPLSELQDRSAVLEKR
jgi:hypothetical protein